MSAFQAREHDHDRAFERFAEIPAFADVAPDAGL